MADTRLNLLSDSVFDGTPVATFVLDRDHRVTHWNRACEVLTGVRVHDILGTNEQWRAFYDHERPVMADIILSGAKESAVSEFYHGKYRPSALIRGAYEAEDFFPAFGDNGKWLFFTAAPLRDAAGEVIGAIETLQDVTRQKLAEMALKKSEERYRLLSQTDDMTRLYNSRHFYERLSKEVERSTRYGRPLSLLLIDADHFKRVNDTYGHQEGDRVLQTLARTIESCLRGSDSAYRYGGEEFLVLMPESATAGAQVVAERIRQHFSTQEIVTADGQTFRCTISIGVTEFLPGDSPATLVKRADAATYQAKELGRNRVVCL